MKLFKRNNLKKLCISMTIISTMFIIIYSALMMKLVFTNSNKSDDDKTVSSNSRRAPLAFARENREVMMEWIDSIWKHGESQQELMDAQYFHLRQWEQRSYIDPVFTKFDANWPCLWGETVIGENRGDGVKWGCGLDLLRLNTSQECIIYSLGSNDDWSFEESINYLLPHCQIFTFDPTVEEAHIPSTIPSDIISFYEWGLSGHDNETSHYYLLSTIMNKLGHSHIDVLKIDVEGFEWPALMNLDKLNLWPSFGQLLIEIHLGTQWYRGFEPKSGGYNYMKALKEMFDVFEKHNLRLFHKEVNSQYGPLCCSEYSFIQKHWHPNNRSYI